MSLLERLNAKLLLKLMLCILFTFAIAFFLAMYKPQDTKREIKLDELDAALVWNRFQIQNYYDTFGEYPILKDEEIYLWDMNRNQYIWRNQFHGLKNIATNPEAIRIRENAWKMLDPNTRKLRGPIEGDLQLNLNPITGKFDWLAEDSKGVLYSPDMPDSILIASPPIRVVNIRCPLTASDPPYYEDFTKW